MVNIVSKKLHFDEDLKKKIEFICGFCNTKPTIINGNIKNIKHTHLVCTIWHTIIKSIICFILRGILKIIIKNNNQYKMKK